MKITTAILAALPAVMAAPVAEAGMAPLNSRSSFTGTYIVKLKDSAGVAASSSVMSLLSTEPEYIYTEVLNGFAATFDKDTLDVMRRHPDVRNPFVLSVGWCLKISN